jgi:hypothetical protein
MLHACAAKFDVTRIMKNFTIFLELNKALVLMWLEEFGKITSYLNFLAKKTSSMV